MEKLKDGGPAFPVQDEMSCIHGMSLRDYFAAKAMQQLMIIEQKNRDGVYVIPVAAYRMADAMIKAREQNN